MPRLFVLSGADLGLEAEVGDRSEIGRGDACAVRLRDGSVSRLHARIERTAEGWALVDLGSRNGIARAGARAERLSLAHGDEVAIGSVVVRFVDESARPLAAGAASPSASPAAELEEIVLDAAEPAGPSAPRGPRAAPEVGSARRRAIASREGVLQFHKIENAPPSLLRDDLGQRTGLAKVLLVSAAVLVAAALFYGAWKLTSAVAPAPPVEETETGR